MAGIETWATSTKTNVGPHTVVHMTANGDSIETGVSWAAAVLPRHYASTDEVASVLKDLGKERAAEFLISKLPTTPRARSGELGEIIGTHYAAREMGYRLIPRLRWKDSREMPMRGDDLIGIRVDEKNALTFLKGEAKSRANLSTATLNEAQTALLRDHGRPSPHALSFVASRLFEQDDKELRNRILAAGLNERIKLRNVTHLLFTFTGNNPGKLLREHTKAYKGKIRRLAVGLHVPQHQKFIRDAFNKVTHNAKTS